MEGLVIELTHNNSPDPSRRKVRWSYQGIGIETNIALIQTATAKMMSWVYSSDKCFRVVRDRYESPLAVIESLDHNEDIPRLRVILFKRGAFREYFTKQDWKKAINGRKEFATAPVNLKSVDLEGSTLLSMLPDVKTDWAIVQFVPQRKSKEAENDENEKE